MDYVTTEQAAEEIGVSPGEIRRLLNNGLLEGRRVPEGAKRGIWCVDKTDLENYKGRRRSRGRPTK